MSGTTPSADLLGRIARGEIGGVILFGSNVTTAGALVALTAELQKAASTAGSRSLLIATDQEGGSVKRIPWAPPTLTVPQMGHSDRRHRSGRRVPLTGAALLALGINTDLAPVADVPVLTSSFMYLDGRTWSFSASVTATCSSAFARGLKIAGVDSRDEALPRARPGAAEHRLAASSTSGRDQGGACARGCEPYSLAIAQPIPMIMLSNATYDAYDPTNGAGWSPADLADAAPGPARVQGRDDHRLADRDRERLEAWRSPISRSRPPSPAPT